MTKYCSIFLFGTVTAVVSLVANCYLSNKIKYLEGELDILKWKEDIDYQVIKGQQEEIDELKEIADNMKRNKEKLE